LKNFVFLLFICLSLPLLTGCNPEKQGVFDLEKEFPPEENSQTFSFAIQSAALPTEAEPSSLITVSDLPDNSIYMSVHQLAPTHFRLDIYAKKIYGLNDLPLTIEYNPNFLSIGSSSEENGPVIGEVLSNKISILPSMNHITVIGEDDPDNFQRYIISVNLLAETGPPFDYFNGKILSLYCSSHPSIRYDTPIGFVASQSMALDKNGNSLAVQFYGGTISKQ
jgi:hypothetical protein